MMQRKYDRWVFGFLLFAVLVFLSGVAFRLWSSPVKGSVNPSNAGIRAWLISKSDTLNAPVIQGFFMITNVKQGNYTLMIEARPPYRDGYKQDVQVVDGQPTDVGVIEMNQ